MKMKNSIYYFCLLCLMVFGSCSDTLNQMPVTETTSSVVYADPANYKKVLAKIYATYVLAGQGQGGANGDLTTVNGHDFSRGYFNLQEASTDEVANTWLSGNNLIDLTYISWSSKDAWVSDTYYWLYYNIALCNEFIRNCSIDVISNFNSADKELILTYRSEARFLRAFSYWMVLDLFRQGPFVNEDTPVSGYIPEAYDGTLLFDFIESELINLTDDNTVDGLPDSNEYGRVSKTTAYALLSRLYLNHKIYRKTESPEYYNKCISACKKVIEMPGLYLEPEYYKLFNADNYKRTNEILFSLVCDATTSVTWGGGTYLVCGSCGNSSIQDPVKYGLVAGWGMFRARGELPQKFGDIVQSHDNRAMFFTEGQSQFFTGPIDNQEEGFFFEKFTNLNDEGEPVSNSSATGCSTDYPLIRLAEIYLTAAEAVLRGGTEMSRQEALELVNKVRLRAYGNNDAAWLLDTDFNLDFILDERARELYLESVRRTDLVRFDKFTTDDYIWQWKGGVLDGRAVDEKYNYYPIPDTDLTANPNLSNPQY